MRTGRPKGYPRSGGMVKGQKKQKTLQWEAIGEALTTRHTERFDQILESADDEKFANLYLQLLEYFKPKQSRVEANIQTSQQVDVSLDFGRNNKV
jgi:hypothetical protein